MKVLLLGTGAADGWPQPFCRCASCVHARSEGNVRARSGVLVDECVLIDPSPDVTVSAALAGVSLDRVTTILIGHSHFDHLDPSVFLAREWIIPRGELGPLVVHGPASALEQIRPWINPDRLSSGDIGLHEVVMGADITLPSGHSARALPAEHGLGANGWPTSRQHSESAHEAVHEAVREAVSEAVLWEVTSTHGQRLLHATDTGPLPSSTRALMRPLDVLLVEETFGDTLDHGTAHLDLATLPHLLSELRGESIVHDQTEIVAIHLSHHNPAEPELVRRLAAWGARPGRDREVITVGTSAEPCVPQPRRVLVTGGARSGKSREAEHLVASHAKVTYVATAAPREDDAEWDDRVAVHRERRPATWTTIETADLVSVVATASDHDAVLIDCLTLWATRIIDESDTWDTPSQARAVVRDRARDLASALAHTSGTIVLVTNEVGSGIMPVNAAARLFADVLGDVNAIISRECDEVLLAVAGRVIPVHSARSALEPSHQESLS